jgi:hypothetical protein
VPLDWGTLASTSSPKPDANAPDVLAIIDLLRLKTKSETLPFSDALQWVVETVSKQFAGERLVISEYQERTVYAYFCQTPDTGLPRSTGIIQFFDEGKPHEELPRDASPEVVLVPPFDLIWREKRLPSNIVGRLEQFLVAQCVLRGHTGGHRPIRLTEAFFDDLERALDTIQTRRILMGKQKVVATTANITKEASHNTTADPLISPPSGLSSTPLTDLDVQESQKQFMKKFGKSSKLTALVASLSWRPNTTGASSEKLHPGMRIGRDVHVFVDFRLPDRSAIVIYEEGEEQPILAVDLSSVSWLEPFSFVSCASVKYKANSLRLLSKGLFVLRGHAKDIAMVISCSAFKKTWTALKWTQSQNNVERLLSSTAARGSTPIKLQTKNQQQSSSATLTDVSEATESSQAIEDDDIDNDQTTVVAPEARGHSLPRFTPVNSTSSPDGLFSASVKPFPIFLRKDSVMEKASMSHTAER